MRNSIVYIIIVTYNADAWFDKCLSPLFPLPEGWKVIIIDNASADSCIQKIRTRYPQVHCVENSENLGFGKANNQGMRLALREGAEYVFLLNQDAWTTPRDIARLVAVQQAHPEFAIVSPVHLTGDATRMDRGFETYCFLPPSNRLFSDLILRREILPIYETGFVNAAAWLVSRDCLLTVGGFDPLFFHYGEDVDYSRRIIQSGKKIGVVPDACACHDREGRISPSEQTLTDIGSCLLVATGSRREKITLFLRVWRLFLRACKQFALLRVHDALYTLKNIRFLLNCIRRSRVPRNCSLTVEGNKCLLP